MRDTLSTVRPTWKGRLLRALSRLPEPIATPIEQRFCRRNTAIYDAEPVAGVSMRLAVPRHNEIWRARLTQPGGHERGVCEWLQHNLRPGEVLFDVGAHLGFYCALASTLQPDAVVHAFEPDFPTVVYLRDNRRLSGNVASWTIDESLVSDRAGPGRVTLDDYSCATGVVPGVVKMDIEGAEILALRGARELIARGETRFLVEVHSDYLPEFGATVADLLALFPDGYRFEVLPDLRDVERAEWSDDLKLLESDRHPYLCATPSALSARAAELLSREPATR